MARKTFSIEFSASKIDKDAGVIHGVSVIAHGPAKGHGLLVDDTTLAQVHAQMSAKRGLKAKLNHSWDASTVIGTMCNPKNEGQRITADLQLLKSSPHRAYVMELAEVLPESVGMSIEFSGQDEQKPDGTCCARCDQLDAVALVDRPAANPTGMFCELSEPKPVDKPNPTNPEPIISMTPEQLAAFNAAQESIKALEAKNADLSKKLSEAPKNEDIKAEVMKALAEMGKAPAAAPAGAPAAAPQEPAKPKTFSDHVADLVKGGMKQTDAMLRASHAHPELYKEYREALGVRVI